MKHDGRLSAEIADLQTSTDIRLDDGSRIGVIGGGPAGSLFSYFLLSLAERTSLSIEVDIYEPRDYSRPGPTGCNMCGGVISESLVQTLAMEGIHIPSGVVQRGIDSYVLHMDVGETRIDTPGREKRIAAVHRGAGPKGSEAGRWQSLDGFLQLLAVESGAKIIRSRVSGIGWRDDRPEIRTKKDDPRAYDLVVVAVGVNSAAPKLFEEMNLGYEAPRTIQTAIREYHVGAEALDEYLGDSMHVFLAGVPGLDFGAMIPKGDYATLCLLGQDMNAEGLARFIESPEVTGCLPPEYTTGKKGCGCSPRMSVRGARRPYADRLVFIGDAGVTRLYKDGIGAAYRTAKAAASTVIFEGISAQDLERHYLPLCRSIERDNAVGKLVFAFSHLFQKIRWTRRAILQLVEWEQNQPEDRRRMSHVLWDLFTGSAPYREVFWRTLHPVFLWRFAVALLGALLGGETEPTPATLTTEERQQPSSVI